MRHIFPITSMVFSIALFAVGFNIADASIGIKSFGGKITKTEAIEVTEAKNESFINCSGPNGPLMDGDTITIKPYGNFPSSYVVESGVRPKTGGRPRVSKLILGLYRSTGTGIIICTNPDGATKTVTLSPITLYGTSR